MLTTGKDFRESYGNGVPSTCGDHRVIEQFRLHVLIGTYMGGLFPPRMVRMITRVEKKWRGSVSYMLDALVNDNLETMQRIFNQELADFAACRILTKQLSAVVNDVQLYYSCDIGLNDDRAHDGLSALHGAIDEN